MIGIAKALHVLRAERNFFESMWREAETEAGKLSSQLGLVKIERDALRAEVASANRRIADYDAALQRLQAERDALRAVPLAQWPQVLSDPNASPGDIEHALRRQVEEDDGA
jgi:hypothetical protein